MKADVKDESLADFQETSAAATIANADRRRSERVTTQVPGWVSAETTDRSAKGRSVTVLDLSLHGVGFHDAQQRYRIGAAHWLMVNGTSMRVSTRIKIASVRKNPNGGFDIGASYF